MPVDVTENDDIWRGMMATVSRRLGRPPDSSSEETRQRILDAARHCFAKYGYDATTNKQLATAAGLTTGAIYHYFDSKRELFCDVQDAVQSIVYARFRETAAAAGPSFAARITAILDTAVQMNRDDPSLAEFLVTVRTDIPRHEELRTEPRLQPRAREEFFGELIDLGISTGELDATDRQATFDVISAIMMGLVSASSGDAVKHERTVDGFKRLLLGTLIHPPH